MLLSVLLQATAAAVGVSKLGAAIGAGLAAEIVDVFLDTEFEGGRHARRVEKIMKLEEK